ncbi:DNA mismatch repair endonuclease MutL [Blautia ammoniilytica]|uniref:DNA mismatch repair protein MutL n=1 Tax=Blautia ammoniilytica TaxID=2981782 RepID=A0ABT2TRS1_9FIRM|nr:DNA mismatch repair endonuclease MutL [Blautia ammoniilytica]MCU6764910.1 DNA mismatch repair endonuclease MutL [Blautia ammoniilytica]
MRKIAVLDKHTIDKIAAGEVVERPSSVVKELVENAIDAGATAVTVEIADGGKRLIRITDNGSGMEADQVPVAFLSHATSKIEKVEDLENIASLGFRGEALSSIAAVSQVELITKTPSALSGVRYVIEGGAEQSMEEMGAPEGTTFLVRNLFYNTPARSKFLKSDAAEGNYISSLMEQLALSHPEISFKYIQNKQVKLHTSGNYNVKDVIYNVYGRDIARALLEVSYENDFLKIQGYVGKPEISRGTRSFENYYINGRYVKNNIIAKAIEDAYKGFLMQHKFPFVSLHIQMTGNDLDVNVHPRKMEVRFARGPEVYDCIYEAVRNVLTHREMIPKVSPGPEETAAKAKTIVERKDIPEPFETKRLTQMQQNIHPVVQKDRLYEELPVYKSNTFTKAEEALFSGNLHKEESSANTTDPIDKQEPKIQESKTQKLKTQEISDSAINISAHKTLESEILKQEQEAPKQLELFEEKLLAPESRSRHRLIGQLFETYWLVEFDDRFFIIDQHAAHEKVNYERFVKQFKEQETHSQYLSPPLIVSLSLEEEASLLANREFFEKAGFEIEPFGGREYSISAVPADLYGFSEEDLFLEMLDNLAGEGEKDALNIFAARLATMACKSAVKGNNKLSFQEADQLIDQLLTLNNPYHCPHGRPTIISMTKTEIEKKFKRII